MGFTAYATYELHINDIVLIVTLVAVVSGKLTECELKRKTQSEKITKESLPDAHAVQCDVDGSYSQVQCNGFTNVCWCVDENGVMVEGTETRERQPDCSPSKSL